MLIYVISFPSENTGLLIHDYGLLKTSDGGNSFSEVIPSSIPDGWSAIEIYSVSTDHFILAGLKPFITDNIVSLYETFDGGLSWDEAIIAPGDEYLSDITCTNNNCFVTGDALYRKFDPTTSTQEMELEKINISPNPTTNYLHIESTDLEIDEIQVLDIYGRFRKSYLLSSNKINITDLPKGLYILRIGFEGGEKLLKFEKI